MLHVTGRKQLVYLHSMKSLLCFKHGNLSYVRINLMSVFTALMLNEYYIVCQLSTPPHTLLYFSTATHATDNKYNTEVFLPAIDN